MSDEKPKAPTGADILSAVNQGFGDVTRQLLALASEIAAVRGTLATHGAKLDAIRNAPTGMAPRAGAGADIGPVPPESTWPSTFPNYGRSKGQPIAGATAGDLDYYANGARRSLADPAKANWHKKERALLAAIEAEQNKPAGANPAQSAMHDPSDSWGAAMQAAPPVDDDVGF